MSTTKSFMLRQSLCTSLPKVTVCNEFSKMVGDKFPDSNIGKKYGTGKTTEKTHKRFFSPIL